MQSKIDAIAYPPTHTYDLGTLIPTGVLAQRVEKIDALVPDFFTGSRFLDVGANKGYFSMRAARGCDKVVAIEPNLDCCDLLGDILPQNAHLFCGTFDDFEPVLGERFDRVFIGNGHHYQYKDAGNWSWVDKLAALSSGTVILEGPVGMECSDMLVTFPDERLRDGFTRGNMSRAFDPHFRFIDRVPSPSYTPDRYIIHYERLR